MSEQKECWSTPNPTPCNEETVKAGGCGCQPLPKSEQNEKLTADQVNEAHEALETMFPMRAQQIPRDLFGMVVDFGARHAAQQVEHATAELRHECEQLGTLLTTVNGAIKYQKDKAEELRKELEAKENGNNNLIIALEEARKSIIKAASVETECFKQIESLNTQLAEAQRQRDEAVKILRGVYWEANTDSEGFPQEPKYDDILRNRIEYFFKINGLSILEQSNQPINLTKMCNDCNGHGYFIKFGTREDHACDTCNGTGKIPRLSSGETKPEFKCIHGLPSEATCIDCLDDSHRPPS